MDNVAGRLRAAAVRLPDKPALVGPANLSFGALDRLVDRAALGFQGLGLAAGDRVVLLLGNIPEFCVALYGALRAGLTAVPVNPGAPVVEIAHVVSDSGARVAVVGAREVAVLVRACEPAPLERVVVVGDAGAGPDGGDPDGEAGTVVSWSRLLADGGAPDPVPVTGETLALLQYTSGTTGRPRGAMLPHAALLANAEQMRGTRLRVEERDVVLCVLPLFHIYALNVALLFPLGRGATVLLLERFSPEETLAEVARHRASVLVGAPPMYAAWAALAEAGRGADLASVRVALSGAAPLSADVAARFTAAYGVPIWEGYGLTETAPLLTTTAMSDHPRAGSVGRPVPDVELRLVDEAGEEVREGDPGEVLARGPNLFAGYWHDPDATARAVDPDGWLRTGDVGYLADGDLYLVDRTTDLVIVNGFNVYPREVEQALGRHPAVREAAVVGVADERTGEAVKAFVVLAGGAGATADEVAASTHDVLARYKWPREVVVVDSLPRLVTGKLKRRELRER